MPYVDKEVKRACNRRWYRRNAEKVKNEVRLRKTSVKVWFREYKEELQCSECDEDNSICLDFHHIDRTTKRDTVCSLVINGYSIETILEEIAKCIVLCANCHRKKHRDEFE